MKIRLSRFQKSLLIVVTVTVIVYILAPVVYEKCGAEYQKIIYNFLYNSDALFGYLVIVLSLLFVAISFIRKHPYLVIPIILLLLFSLLPIFSTGRMENDALRKVADIKQLQLTAELFYDVNDRYPESLEELVETNPPIISGASRDLVTKKNYDYRLSEGGESYVLRAFMDDYSDDCRGQFKKRREGVQMHLESANDLDGNVFGLDCNDPAYCVVEQFSQ